LHELAGSQDRKALYDVRRVRQSVECKDRSTGPIEWVLGLLATTTNLFSTSQFQSLFSISGMVEEYESIWNTMIRE